MFDVTLVVVFGIVGYLMKKFGFEPGPLVLAFVLGSLLESSLRRSLLVFGGDPTGFFSRPISATLLHRVRPGSRASGHPERCWPSARPSTRGRPPPREIKEKV